ncbi:MAG: DNA mismatch repair endonuclease MutL [Armatimonadetes bacterium]|nr:DNA mismatch repair endonuclease MutL [Armatimonadota bacterium]
MSRIALLDEATIGQIAAGEVVERPVSIVKELVENSIDAGATRIAVAAEEGGCRRLVVTDDGCGLTRDEVVLALQRHATSKLRTARDLSRVRTLGFRGEALASIAAVSAVEVVTRPPDATSGVRLLARGGIITDLQEVGAPAGTRVTVHDLFFNVPVRRRYLRSPATELSYIADCVSQYALAHPEIAFRLTHAGETVVHHGGSGTLADAVVAIFGAEAARQMLPVTLDGEQCALSGVVSPPAFTRGTRAWQWFFVNGRPIRSRVLAHAVEQAYHTLVPSGRYPVAVLLLTLNPQLFDANVHPAKSEVRFLAGGDLHRFVHRAVRETLEAADLTPRVGSPVPPLQAAPALSFPATTPPAATPPEVRAQLHDTYILAETQDGLFIIDQHTAHERALFEQLMAGSADDLTRPQALTVPFVLSLAAHEAAAVREHLETLSAVGFALEPFGREAFLVRSVPAALAQFDGEAVLREVVEELLEERSPQSVEARREKVIARIACRSAVKAGDRLTLPEMQAIVRGLYDLRSRFTCQHGRPTAILLSRDELERRFHRT